jgi:hypothetical protein
MSVTSNDEFHEVADMATYPAGVYALRSAVALILFAIASSFG